MEALATTLTKIELEGLHYMCNLGDAHTRKLPIKAYESITGDLVRIFNDADLQDYYSLRQGFITEYTKLIGQSYRFEQVLLSYASSISMEVVANFLRLSNLNKVALVEPTFDNIPDILVRHGIELAPFADSDSYGVLGKECTLFRDCNAIFVTIPNNPTGEIVSKESFKLICQNCSTAKTLLIVDACFRLFSSQMLNYDMREICEETGVDYIIIEDTGKYWPLHDLKIGIIACSRSLIDRLNDIHTDLLLNVSPFILSLLKEFVRIELKLERRPIIEIISENRLMLKKALEARGLRPYNFHSTVSVEFIDITCLHSRSSEICELLKAGGVITLPGKEFYWTGNEQGEKYLRVALARAPEFFENSVRRMMEVLDKNVRK